MTARVLVERRVLETTVAQLQEAGRTCSERVVLWLAQRSVDAINVTEVYVPVQESASDYFHIPRSSILDILGALRARNGMIAAQVHSHPGDAFHSAADDEWAVVRHVGALSIVIPRFAMHTSAVGFFDDAAVFQLSQENRWSQVPCVEVPRIIEVIS